MATRPTTEELAQLEEFLQPSMIAVVATVGRTGMPHLTPNWYRFADGRLTMSTTKERVKYRNLSRDSQMAVCIYSGTDAGQYATITGTAEISDDDSIWPETRAIIERYVRPEGVEDRMRLLRTQDRVIISLTPERVVFRA
jgi:PPOX class probable F420-dependent enzyme